MEHRITAITAQKRNPHRVNIYLDGEYAFSLQRIIAAWLEVGNPIDDEKILKLKVEDDQEKAYQKVLNWLNFRQRTQNEVQRKLEGYALSEEVITSIIERLKNNGLLNDTLFAEAWIENRNASHPRGRRALAYELRQRGVEANLVDEALLEIDEEQLAYQAGQKRAPRFSNLEYDEFRLKLYRFLAQRGFPYDVISSVIPRLWSETHNPDNFPEEGV